MNVVEVENVPEALRYGIFFGGPGHPIAADAPIQEDGRDGVKPVGTETGTWNLVQQVQFFARLEADSPAGSNWHFSASSGVASDAGFARFYAEDAKSTQFDAIASGKSILHAEEDGIDGGLGLHPRKPSAFGNFMYHVLFDQLNDSLQPVGCPQSCVTPC